MGDRAANRLAGETSPYLLQHAHNPVDWFPWGAEALAKARNEAKPIFLSVGYAACHWCHVMERESFEDESTARLLNDHFVSVKVDREERPDIDGIYMDAVQAMNRGQGGWPMSVFLTPEGKPFYAGTYFPREARPGMPSFTQVLRGIIDSWRDRRGEVDEQGTRVLATIQHATTLTSDDRHIDEELTADAFASLRGQFDTRWGGFGGAPKFPQPMTLEFCLRMAVRGVPDALEMVTLTLDRMAAGGIHDQLGGGFARYATDQAWHVPHFEKMLYDNAQLAQLFTRAWLMTGEDRHRQVVTGTLDYLLREMQHPEGGFFSSQDADSEGVEGRFFTWTWEELSQLVGEPVAIALGASPAGNWAGNREGTNVLWRPVSTLAVAAELGLDPDELSVELEDARSSLFEVRERRIHPATDDKILTAWNALAIRAFAEAGRSFGEQDYTRCAERCAEFVWQHLRDDRGRLLRSWRRGTAGRTGFADDHALLVDALLTLYESTGEVVWFERAVTVADELLRLFHDEERGGFFQTGADADPLVLRPKELYDNAVPSGNAAAAEAMLRLFLFTGEARYEEAALGAMGLVRGLVTRAPSAFGHALCAADLLLGPAREIAIVGERDDPATQALIDEVVQARFLPNSVLAFTTPARQTHDAERVPLLRGRGLQDGRPAAFVCERFACGLPATSTEVLATQLT